MKIGKKRKYFMFFFLTYNLGKYYQDEKLMWFDLNEI